ncbi:hypothetical protein RIF29_15824 [Crotalaria pallida]|uniref:Transcription factor MYC/MYB N-terminal domain-containing protein n=1 Tax=Crotalaria pallida TaxID=3830 RepID=A0AAN9FEA4_CROPI
MLADKALKGYENTSENWVLRITALSGAFNGTTRAYLDGMQWEGQGAYDRSRGNRRNWILVWEDGFCNFAASAAAAAAPEINTGDCPNSSVYGNCEFHQPYQGLQPELFFKMSHEIYNYGEGLIGKVAADHSHKWIYKEPNDQEINFLSAWHNSADSDYVATGWYRAPELCGSFDSKEHIKL